MFSFKKQFVFGAMPFVIGLRMESSTAPSIEALLPADLDRIPTESTTVRIKLDDGTMSEVEVPDLNTTVSDLKEILVSEGIVSDEREINMGGFFCKMILHWLKTVSKITPYCLQQN